MLHAKYRTHFIKQIIHKFGSIIALNNLGKTKREKCLNRTEPTQNADLLGNASKKQNEYKHPLK